MNAHLRLDELTQKEFIQKIKTDDEFARVWGELGPIYGKQWRDWDGRQDTRWLTYDMSLDQIAKPNIYC